MPLPDAKKKSPRVYPLLQNTDLENIAFATLQSTGTPIAIEKMNEDELRRLVLVNLARLSVKGEWDGLLSAGGGGGESLTGSPNGDWQSGYNDYQCIASNGWAASQATTNTDISSGRGFFRPFISSMTATVTEMLCYVTVASASGNVRIGIYNSADDGNPSSLIGYGDFVTTSTGTVTVTSFSSTISLTRGSLYWYGVVQTTAGSGSGVQLQGANATYSSGLYLSNSYTQANWCCVDYTNTAQLMDPADVSDMRGDNASYNPILVGLKFT